MAECIHRDTDLLILALATVPIVQWCASCGAIRFLAGTHVDPERRDPVIFGAWRRPGERQEVF